jgi:hypothetical protein
MGCWIRQEHRLERCRQNRDQTRSSERRWAVAAELRAARHLSSYAADVAQGSVQVIHSVSLYSAKYPEPDGFVKITIFSFSRGQWTLNEGHGFSRAEMSRSGDGFSR